MPGFNIGSQGDGPSNTAVETHRAHRWIVEKLGPMQVRNETIIAESFKLPDVNIDVQEIQGALVKYKFAKGVWWDDAQITLYDVHGLLPMIELEWRDQIYTNDGGIGQHIANGNGYKFPTRVKLIDGAGENVLTFTLMNSWPSKISHGNLSYGSSDIKLLTIDLKYDWAEIEQGFPSPAFAL